MVKHTPLSQVPFCPKSVSHFWARINGITCNTNQPRNAKNPLGSMAISSFQRLCGLKKRASWIQRHMMTNSRYFITWTIAGFTSTTTLGFNTKPKKLSRMDLSQWRNWFKLHRKPGWHKGSACQGRRRQCLRRRAVPKPWDVVELWPGHVHYTRGAMPNDFWAPRS